MSANGNRITLKTELERLRVNLKAIRKVYLFWSAQKLADRIGITKTTISNLELNKTEMSLTLYLALRVVIDYEIERDSTNVLLEEAMSSLVDNGDESSWKERILGFIE